jgi:hypothetical protein
MTLAGNLLTDSTYSGKPVVICWHHGQIPALMHALGAKDGDYPRPWDETVFDLILKVDFTQGSDAKVAKVSQFQEPF